MKYTLQGKEYDSALSHAAAYAKEEARILNEIPAEFHSALSKKAYDDGHSVGYDEVLIHLADLADTLRTPIEQFKTRILVAQRQELKKLLDPANNKLQG